LWTQTLEQAESPAFPKWLRSFRTTYAKFMGISLCMPHTVLSAYQIEKR
jgi:hypothetical protein